MTKLASLTATGVALCLALGAPALAQSKATGKAKAKPQIEQIEKSKAAQSCPPGLAKKSPACTPPGQAKKASPKKSDAWTVRVGNSLDGRDYVTVRPWQYGLEPAPRGSRYAVYDGMLVRIDEDTAEVLNLIRAVTAIAD